MDNLSWRHVWTSRRRGHNRRRSPYCINWLGDDGRPHRLSYPTLKARDHAKILKERELNAWAAPPAQREWRDLVAEYVLSIATSSSTHRYKVARVLEHFSRLCEPVRSDLIPPAMCDQFMIARAAGQPTDAEGHPVVPSSATRKTERTMLSTFFGWCVQRGYMPSNPMATVSVPRVPQRIRRSPKASEWVKLLRVLNDAKLPVDDAQAWHVLILLAVVTGYRQRVLLNCYFGVPLTDSKRLEQLEQRHRRDGGFSVVQLADSRDGIGLLFTFTGKTLKESAIGLPKIVTDRIAVRIGDLPAGTPRLLPWSLWQRKAWARINRSAGLALTFHTLRAVSGTRAAIAKAERAAAEQLDHSSPRVTREHYLDGEQIARAVAIGQALPRLPKLPPYCPRVVPRSRPRPRRGDSGPPPPAAGTAGPAGVSAS